MKVRHRKCGFVLLARKTSYGLFLKCDEVRLDYPGKHNILRNFAFILPQDQKEFDETFEVLSESL